MDRINSTITNGKLKVSELEGELQELKGKWHLVQDKQLVSQEHSDDCKYVKRKFKDVIQLLTFATVEIADKGLKIELSERERNKWLM